MLERYKVWTHNIVNLVFFIFEQEWSFRRRDEKSSLQSTEKNVVVDAVQTALFYLVNGQHLSTPVDVHFYCSFHHAQLRMQKPKLNSKSFSNSPAACFTIKAPISFFLMGLINCYIQVCIVIDKLLYFCFQLLSSPSQAKLLILFGFETLSIIHAPNCILQV